METFSRNIKDICREYIQYNFHRRDLARSGLATRQQNANRTPAERQQNANRTPTARNAMIPKQQRRKEQGWFDITLWQQDFVPPNDINNVSLLLSTILQHCRRMEWNADGNC